MPPSRARAGGQRKNSVLQQQGQDQGPHRIMGCDRGGVAAQRSRETAESPGEGDSGRNVPDLTLPLVEMAEMERPVMDVTMTDSRMMSQVNTVWG